MAHRDQITCTPFTIDELKDIEDLSEPIKTDLCKLITKVFIGSRYSVGSRPALDQAIDAGRECQQQQALRQAAEQDGDHRTTASVAISATKT